MLRYSFVHTNTLKRITEIYPSRASIEKKNFVSRALWAMIRSKEMFSELFVSECSRMGVGVRVP